MPSFEIVLRPVLTPSTIWTNTVGIGNPFSLAYTVPLSDVSRPERSRPAEGYPAAHQAEQERLVREAFSR